MCVANFNHRFLGFVTNSTQKSAPCQAAKISLKMVFTTQAINKAFQCRLSQQDLSCIIGWLQQLLHQKYVQCIRSLIIGRPQDFPCFERSEFRYILYAFCKNSSLVCNKQDFGRSEPLAQMNILKEHHHSRSLCSCRKVNNFMFCFMWNVQNIFLVLLSHWMRVIIICNRSIKDA